MAIPSRFLKPAANRAPKKPEKPTPKKPTPKANPTKAGSAINPTVTGVLLSVFAHGLFIAFGPRANFSFAALTEAAQLQEVEETIVPVVELTPADRNRLPGFAQPRRLPSPPTGLDGLQFSPGLPNTGALSTPQQRPPSSRTTQSRSLPSATPRNQTSRRQTTPRISSLPLGPLSVRRTPTNPGRARTSQPTPVLQTTTPLDQSDLGALSSSQSDIQITTREGLGTQNGVPQPPGTRGPRTTSSSGAAADLLTPEIEQQARASAGEVSPESSDPNAIPPTGEEQGEEIVVERPVIDIASAQDDPPRLLEGFIYDGRETTEDEAAVNLDTWLAETAESKSELENATTSLEIDSKFKVCKENPPNQGLIGVLVNPDGTQEQAKILRSIGYDILNRQALSAVEYNDFGLPETATQYQVTIDVIYEPEGCVDELPEVE